MAVSTCTRVFPSFECCSKSDFSGVLKVGGDGKQRRNRFYGEFKSVRGTASFQGGLSSLIFRFPSNFLRQLSMKVLWNCSNIGVAKIVVALWSNSPASAEAAASIEPSLPLVGDDVALVDKKVDLDVNVGVDFELEGLPNSKRSVFSYDGSLAIHAGNKPYSCFPFFFFFL